MTLPRIQPLLALLLAGLVACGTPNDAQHRTGVAAPQVTAQAGGSVSGTPSPDTAAPDSTDYWGSFECGLHHLARTRAVVWAHPADIQLHAFADAQTVSFEISVSKVVWTRASTTIEPGRPLTVTVYTDYTRSPASLEGTVAKFLWPALTTGTDQLLTLRDDPYSRSEFELDGLIDDSFGLRFIPESCKFSEHFASFAKRLGRPANLSLYVDYASEIEKTEQCLAQLSADPAARYDCPAPMDEVADRASHELTEPTVLTTSRDELWNASDPTTRSLTFDQVPADVVDNLVLLGIHVEYRGNPSESIYSFRCKLGVSFSWGTQGLFPVFPVAACKDSQLELTMLGADGSQVVLGAIDPTQFEVQEGMAVEINFESAPPSMSVRALQDGELEKITGWNSSILEGLRTKYSTASTVAVGPNG